MNNDGFSVTRAPHQFTFAAQQPVQQPRKSFLLDQLSTVGGILGGIGGSFIAPVVGTAGGAAAGSAAGEALENILTGRSVGENVGKEALLGGVFGAGPLRLARTGFSALRAGGRTLPKATEASGTKAISGEVIPAGASPATQTSVQGKLATAGNKLLASQYGTISKPVARATRPEATFGQLADYGLTKPEDVERIASKFTGANGIVNKAVIKATGRSGRISTDGIQRVFDDAVEINGLVDVDAKSAQQVFRAQMKKLMGGPSGSLRPDADPSDVLDVMKALEKRVADLTGKGSNYRLTTPQRADQAKVLQTVRDELQERLFQASAARGGIKSVLTPEFRSSLIALQPKSLEWQRFVDDTVMKSRDIGALRSAMAPFVRARQIINEADINSMTFGGRTGNLANGLLTGSLAGVLGPVAGVVNEVAQQAARNPIARATSAGLRRAGTMPPTVTSSVSRLAPRGIAARLGAVGAITGGLNQGTVSAQQPSGIEDAALSPGTSYAASPIDYTDPLAPSNIGNSVRQILSGGGTLEDALSLVSLADTVQKLQEGGGSSGLNSTAAGVIADTQTGLNSLSDLYDIIGQSSANNPIIGQIRGLNPLDTNAQSLQQQIAATKQIVGKALEGGVLRKEDEAKYAKILPTIGDTDAVAKAKIEQLYNLISQRLNEYQSRLAGGTGALDQQTLESALLSSGI